MFTTGPGLQPSLLRATCLLLQVCWLQQLEVRRGVSPEGHPRGSPNSEKCFLVPYTVKPSQQTISSKSLQNRPMALATPSMAQLRKRHPDCLFTPPPCGLDGLRRFPQTLSRVFCAQRAAGPANGSAAARVAKKKIHLCSLAPALLPRVCVKRAIPGASHRRFRFHASGLRPGSLHPTGF